MEGIRWCKWVWLLSLLFMSCDGFLDIEPKGRVIPKTLKDFRLLMDGAYNSYQTGIDKSILAFRTDEIKSNEKAETFQFFKDIYLWHDATPDPLTQEYPYREFYRTIFYVNHIVNEGNKTLEVAPGKAQLMGEAFALRAYAYFGLVNFYGKPYNPETADSDPAVPLVLDLDLERHFKPQSVQRIYEQISIDISAAKKHLKISVPETGLNYRFSTVALYALAARVNLYMGGWESALKAADKALSLKNTLVDLNGEPKVLPWEENTPESILALETIFLDEVQDAAYASESLIHLYDPATDLRFPLYFSDSDRDGNYAIEKKDYICSFRVAELYLIQSEALLHLGRLDDAKNALLTLIQNRYKTESLPEKKGAHRIHGSERFYGRIICRKAAGTRFGGTSLV